MKTFKEAYPDAKEGDKFEIIKCHGPHTHGLKTGTMVRFKFFYDDRALMRDDVANAHWLVDAADVRRIKKGEKLKTKIKAPKGKVIDTIKQDDDKAVVTFKSIDDRPMSWIEYLEANEVKYRKIPEPDDDLYAMYQLRLLRNAWRKMWLPDYTNVDQVKWSIIFSRGNIRVFPQYCSGALLAFETKEDAALFLEKFGDIIQSAKPYLGG